MNERIDDDPRKEVLRMEIENNAKEKRIGITKRNFEQYRCPECNNGTFLAAVSRELIIDGGDMIRLDCTDCEHRLELFL